MKLYTFNLKRKFNILSTILLFILLSMFLILNAKHNFNITKNLFMYWVQILIPSLLPFYIFSEFILQSNMLNIISYSFRKFIYRIFRLPFSSTIPITLGFISGFPIAAKSINELVKSNNIDKKNAEKLMLFVNNANPVFVVSAIGIGLFNDISIGLLLLISHYLSSIILGILININNDIIHEDINILNTFDKKYSIISVIRNSILNSFNTLFIVFGYILIFNMFAIFILNNIPFSNQITKNIFLSIIEMTNGINYLSNISMNEILKLVIISFSLSFSGLCILAQCYSQITEFKFSFIKLIYFSIIKGIISTLITYILIKYSSIFSLKEYLPANSNIILNELEQSSLSINLFVISISTILIIFSIIKIFTILYNNKKSY